MTFAQCLKKKKRRYQGNLTVSLCKTTKKHSAVHNNPSLQNAAMLSMWHINFNFWCQHGSTLAKMLLQFYC